MVLSPIYESVLSQPKHVFLEFWWVSGPFIPVKENQSWTPIKRVKINFILKHTHTKFAIGRKRFQHRTGLNSEHSMGKRGFIAKHLVGVQGLEYLRGNIRNKEGFWLYQIDKVLAKVRPG